MPQGFRRYDGLIQAVPSGTHFDQQRAGKQILIKPLGAEIDGSHQPRPGFFQLNLQLYGQRHIFLPVGVAEAAFVGADHHHQLGGLPAVYGRGGVHLAAVAVFQGIPVDILDQPDPQYMGDKLLFTLGGLALFLGGTAMSIQRSAKKFEEVDLSL